MFGRVGVLMGGISREKDISLKSGEAIFTALKRQNLEVSKIICEGNIQKELHRTPIDVAFLALHGRYGEDGTIQMQLEELGIPYTGSGVMASSLAIDKKKSKEIFDAHRIKTPPWKVLQKGEFLTSLPFPFPLVIKPVSEGSSIGLSIVDDEALAKRVIANLLETSKEILLEKYIPGKELTVGILGSAALPVIEIVPKRTFYDYIAKYEKGNSEYKVPAPLNEQQTTLVQHIAEAAHAALGCRDMSRVDIILSKDGTPYVLEINTIPGFTETSLLPKAAQAHGMSFDSLCLALLEMAAKRKEHLSSQISL